MDRQIQPPFTSQREWLSIGIVPISVTVLGASSWTSHWDYRARRSRRCAGLGCALCAQGYDRQVRYVFLVRTFMEREAWLELRSAQYPVLVSLQELHGSLIGMRLTLSKQSAKPNAKVLIEYEGRDDSVTIPRRIEAFVAKLGLPPTYR